MVLVRLAILAEGLAFHATKVLHLSAAPKRIPLNLGGTVLLFERDVRLEKPMDPTMWYSAVGIVTPKPEPQPEILDASGAPVPVEAGEGT